MTHIAVTSLKGLRFILVLLQAFPVDASLLHAALQELEALAEDSTSDGAGSAMTLGFDALYLEDVTYPDGSVVLPGKEFVKTWRVVNNGVVPWNEEVRVSVVFCNIMI